MSITRWFLYASFTGGIIALSLQPSGIANAAQASTILVTDQSSSSNQEQRDSRSGKKGMSDAESSGKMQSDKDSLTGEGHMGKNPKISINLVRRAHPRVPASRIQLQEGAVDPPQSLVPVIWGVIPA